MCPSKPKMPKAPTLAAPAPPLEKTATEFVRDGGGKSSTASTETKRKRKSSNDLKVDLAVPSASSGLAV